jgi:hypothetical protein
MPRKPPANIAANAAQIADWQTRERTAALIEAETGLPVPARSLEKWPLPRKLVFNTALIHVPSARDYARNAIAIAPVTRQGALEKKARKIPEAAE